MPSRPRASSRPPTRAREQPAAAAPVAPAAQPQAPTRQAAQAVSRPIDSPARPVAGLLGTTPPYPEAARRRNEQGKVVVLAVVSTDGRAVQATVTSSSGYAALDRAALAAVMTHYRFVPAQRGGVAVQGTAVIPFDFRLGTDQ